ncbi:TonB-dependent receptor domain-containing protein [Aurantiacibacter suaedae]|uniref:TonB-dependent receptor domain-containing protein n=1 Tax=Aurantiacibacter suaedae TaxID=2545755 RepID=UPI001F502163|nr:TonB-dependent receptor [Aurantiacibacter suaedae]
MAQDSAPTAASAQSDRIVVTGSRIVRRDFEANSPIVTVDEGLLEDSGTAAIEQNLNKLPQFTAVNNRTPTTGGGDIQPNASNTPGAAAVALRGIGANRTLVLVDGRRATPSNATGIVDINTIPSAAIERVEIISGGASSTYGADAVAGVTNFILKSNFEGLELDGQMGITEQGDNFEYQLSGIMGADFEDGRGNVSIAFSMNTRESALQRDRDYYNDLWSDPTIGGTAFFAPYAGVNIGFGGNFPDAGAVNSVIDGATFAPGPVFGTVIYSDYDGNTFSGLGDAFGIPGTSGADGLLDGTEFFRQANGQLGYNNQFNYLVFPLTRYNLYANGDYEVNDWLSVFATGFFSKTETQTVQEPGPLTGGWAARIDPTINRDVIPDDLLTILDSRPDADAPFELRALLPFNRTSDTDVHTINLTAGIRGNLPLNDWTYEAFVQHGETQVSAVLSGVASLERMRTIIGGPNFGEGFSTTGNEEFGGFGGASASCTSGLNFFAPETITQDCFDAIGARLQNKSTVRQTIVETNLQGALFELPAGEVRMATGVSYRETDYEFINDNLTTQGRSFNDQALGIYPSGDSEGYIEVREVYGELLIPILSDIPGIQQFNLELGGRLSDYSTTGTSYTYKVLGEWEVTDWLRFRGGYNRAERAPNIAELFLAPEQTFAVAPGGDVCSINNPNGFSANPDVNANFTDAIALCGALMEASGSATSDDIFYGTDYRNLLGATNRDELAALVANPNTQGAGPAFTFPTTEGNANLRPEKADTWTAGAVIQSPFTSPALSRLRLAVDYYNIELTDAIGLTTVDIVQRQCFDPALNPGLDPNAVACQRANRNQTGGLDDVFRTYQNSGSFQTSGIDIALDWAMDAGPGTVTFSTLFNYIISMEANELPIDDRIDYVGTQGPNNNGLNGNTYEYRAFTTLGYSIDGYRLALQWSHLPSIDSATSAQFPNTTIQGVTESYNLFNLNGSAAVADNLTIRFGVENLFGEEPPLSGRNTNPPPGQLQGGSFAPGAYDTIGRRFYLGANVKF